MDYVDNLPSSYKQITHRKTVDKHSAHQAFPHFHRAYYYYGYLFIYLVSNIKKKKGTQSS